MPEWNKVPGGELRVLKLLAISTAVFALITFFLGLITYIGITVALKYFIVFGIISLFLVLACTHYLYHGAARSANKGRVL